MRRALKTIRQQYESGSIAVEAAIVLPILIVFLALPTILVAFYYRKYTAAQKAVHDAAIYLSTAPRLDFATLGPDTYSAAVTVANKIVAKELAGIVPDGTDTEVSITCYYLVSGKQKANFCKPGVFNLDSPLVGFDVAINLPFVNPFTGTAIPSAYMSIIPSVPYMGN